MKESNMYTEFSMSLYKSFGIKSGASIKLINEPTDFIDKLKQKEMQFVFHRHLKDQVDLIHLFTKSKKELSVELHSLVKYLKKDGTIVVSWPKETERFSTDLNEDIVNGFGTQLGLVKISSNSIEKNWATLAFTNKQVRNND
jgi:hypothetical protein